MNDMFKPSFLEVESFNPCDREYLAQCGVTDNCVNFPTTFLNFFVSRLTTGRIDVSKYNRYHAIKPT